MTEAAAPVSERAAALRREFDRAFADPPASDAAAGEGLLAIRLGAQVFALRMSEIAGLSADKKITRVPGGGTALLGLAGFRGALLPVYDLQALLGHSRAALPRWLAIAAAAPVALAFETFEGQLRVSADAMTRRQANADTHDHTRDFVQTGNVLRPIVELSSVLAAIEARDHPQGVHQHVR